MEQLPKGRSHTNSKSSLTPSIWKTFPHRDFPIDVIGISLFLLENKLSGDGLDCSSYTPDTGICETASIEEELVEAELENTHQ